MRKIFGKTNIFLLPDTQEMLIFPTVLCTYLTNVPLVSKVQQILTENVLFIMYFQEEFLFYDRLLPEKML